MTYYLHRPTTEELTSNRNAFYAATHARLFAESVAKAIKDITPSNIYKQFGYVMIANCLDRVMNVAVGRNGCTSFTKNDWTYFKRFAKVIEPMPLDNPRPSEVFFERCKQLADEERNIWMQDYRLHRPIELGKCLPKLPNFIAMVSQPRWYANMGVFIDYQINSGCFFLDIADMLLTHNESEINQS